MTAFSLPLTRLIHENISIIMSFCFSRQPLLNLVETRFLGEWKYLNKALFEVSQNRAERACLELAVFLRLLDDDEDLSGYLRQAAKIDFGRLLVSEKPDKPLHLRDVCNKIIHASELQWDLSENTKPLLICNSKEPEKWIKAEINVVSLASYCGELMS